MLRFSPPFAGSSAMTASLALHVGAAVITAGLGGMRVAEREAPLEIEISAIEAAGERAQPTPPPPPPPPRIEPARSIAASSAVRKGPAAAKLVRAQPVVRALDEPGDAGVDDAHSEPLRFTLPNATAPHAPTHRFGTIGALVHSEPTFSAAQVGVPARLLASAPLVYPARARAAEIEGDVEVEIVVDTRGRVVDARVARPAGYGLDEAALVAVRGYRFSPASRDGAAVRVRMRWSVQFQLR